MSFISGSASPRPFDLVRAALLSSAALLWTSDALAQAAPTSDPALVPAPQAPPVGTKRVYTPADFARFAPKTAYDMLLQVPGFTIRSASQERGLGQASENVLINGQRSANKSGGAIDDLQKIGAANVERIEIVDAASLGIAGLSPDKSPTSSSKPPPNRPASSNGSRTSAPISPSRTSIADCSATRARRGRSSTLCRSRTSLAAAASAG